MLDDALSETRSAVQEPTSSSVLKPKKKRKRGLDGSVKDKKRKHESLESAVGSQTIVTNDPQNEKNQNAKKVPPDQHEETTFADDLLFAQMVPPIDLPLSGHADVSQSFLSQPQYMAPPFASSHAPRPEEVFPSQFHDSSPFGQQYQEGFPPLAEALPDFAYGTNEDILRVIQGLDLSKITNVLKTLEGAAAASDPSLSGVPLPDQAQSSQAYQAPSSSENILDQPNTEPTRQKGKRPLPAVFPTSSFEVNEEHAQLLAKKWLSTTKLAELVKTQGLVYKKGKFSAIEEQQLKTAIEGFRERRELTEQGISDIIFAKGDKARDNAFWSEITAAAPLRPIIAVYHHVRRTRHPFKQQGRWMPTEDTLLKQAVADFGQQWEKVSERVGRMASDCRDRYRNHIVGRDIRVAGPWTKAEEDELIQIVTDMTVKQGKGLDDDVFWGKVSEKMSGRRGRQQCRIKWTDALSKQVKSEGQKSRWSQLDAYILVHKIDSLGVLDDTEIDWKTLPDDEWNLWSPHCLQRRWFTLKKSIKGHEDMTHQEIMDILRVKKAQLPSPTSSKRRHPTSVAVIESED